MEQSHSRLVGQGKLGQSIPVSGPGGSVSWLQSSIKKSKLPLAIIHQSLDIPRGWGDENACVQAAKPWHTVASWSSPTLVVGGDASDLGNFQQKSSGFRRLETGTGHKTTLSPYLQETLIVNESGGSLP